MAQAGDGRERISRQRYDELQSQLAHAEDQLARALEDAADTMRGYADKAAKAAVAATVAPMSKRVADLREMLRRVIPEDEYIRSIPLEGIIAESRRHEAWCWLETWEGNQKTGTVPMPEGPVDPVAVAAGLRAEGRTGELRLMAQDAATGVDRCWVTIQLD